MVMTPEDIGLKFRTAIFTMSDMASDLSPLSYERTRLMAKAAALSEGLEIVEALLMQVEADDYVKKYELSSKLVWADWVDATNAVKQLGEWQESTSFAKAVGTRDGFAIALGYVKDAINED